MKPMNAIALVILLGGPASAMAAEADHHAQAVDSVNDSAEHKCQMMNHGDSAASNHGADGDGQAHAGGDMNCSMMASGGEHGSAASGHGADQANSHDAAASAAQDSHGGEMNCSMMAAGTHAEDSSAAHGAQQTDQADVAQNSGHGANMNCQMNAAEGHGGGDQVHGSNADSSSH